MAKYLKTVAGWKKRLILDSRAAVSEGDLIGAALIERKLALEEVYLKDSITLLRKFVKGFEAADGFSLNKIGLIPDKQLTKVREYAPQIRQEISHISKGSKGEAREHFKLVSPRSERGRKALAAHLGQTALPGRKVFVLHTDRPDQTSVEFIDSYETVKDKRGRKKRVKTTRVEVVQRIGKRKYMERFYYFEDQPVTFDEILAETRRMLKKMPNGYYTFVSSRYGDIGMLMVKSQIIPMLQEYFLGYDKLETTGKDNRGLAETLRGYRYISDTADGARRYSEVKETNRQKFDAFRKAQRQKERRKVLNKLGYH